MVVLMPIERETLQVFFKHISQMLNVSTFGNTADIIAIVHLVPHASAYHGRPEPQQRGYGITKGGHIEHLSNIYIKKLGEFLSLSA